VPLGIDPTVDYAFKKTFGDPMHEMKDRLRQRE
jgi:hypothetical protein